MTSYSRTPIETFVKFAETHDHDIRDEIIVSYLGLAEYLASRFNNRGEPLEDLIQVAYIGLVKAVDRFDTSRNVEFSTYATHTIVGELKRHFRDHGWTVRTPRRIQENHLKLSKQMSTLYQKLGRSPSVAELAKELHMSEEDVLEAMEAGQGYRTTSLDYSASDEDTMGTLADKLGIEDPNLSISEDRIQITKIAVQLTDRERIILYLRFFEGLTQSEIAKKLNISQMHVSRLLTSTLARLRSA